MTQYSRSPRHTPSGRLSGLTALVTGAASGVGLDIARVFHAEGASIAAADIDDARLRERLGASSTLLTGRLDVTDEEQCRHVADLARERFGAIDILVNNAGATIRGAIEETTPDLFMRTIDVNLGSMVRLARLIAPGMCRRRRGSIINMASITATEGQPGAIAYTASKGGCTAMTRALAIELAPYDVRVNSISPTVIDTPMTHDHVTSLADPGARYADLMARQPLGRMASARDVALAALFLASEESAFITGADIPVDGGRSAA